ncbi:FAD-dependent oxidoreductase [Streptomyces sp. NPDC059378]|uniref:FAD-dependent oxidoreductase n=1 Tax=Streptomyces sp. NPDC059378 TaxID=3346815 RepID=UPI0036CA6C3C
MHPPAVTSRRPCRVRTRLSHAHAARGAGARVGWVALRADGVLHFAGEATCGHEPATVHGALHSGHRAAEHIRGSPWPNSPGAYSLRGDAAGEASAAKSRSWPLARRPGPAPRGTHPDREPGTISGTARTQR